MFLRFCQLKTLIFGALILNSCSFNKEKSPLEGVSPQARWFLINSDHALEDIKGVKRHLFFDSASRIDWRKNRVKFVALTPGNTEYSHGFDMASGQAFVKHQYCAQNDVWGQYSGTVNRPPYTQGFLPRVLDQLGEPQRIIHFSKKNQLKPFEQYEASIIAGYVESICPLLECSRDQWISRLVLVGVDPEDEEMQVFKISKIKEKLNWPKVKAHIENAEGRNYTGNDTSPKWKSSELISVSESMKFFRKRAKFFKGSELLKIQKSCHEIYDKLWTEVGESRVEDLPAMNAQEIKRKGDVINLLREAKQPIGFQARFAHFTNEHYKDVLTCSKFIYAGNVNKDAEKFWFLNHIKAFYLLYQQGYYFNCSDNSWKRNTFDEKAHPIYSVNDTLKECKLEQIDMAMNYMQNFIRSEKEKLSYFMRFIDYDNQGMGTHEKIYNWVHFPRIKLTCNEDKHRRFLQNMSIFVNDVQWKMRGGHSSAYDDKVIY